MKRSTVHPHKALVVDHLKDLLSRSKSVAIVDYKGLKVSQVTQLRRDIAKAGGDMVVAKNTLFKIASGHTDLTLEGTSAFIFSQSDEVSALKAVRRLSLKKNPAPPPPRRLLFFSGFSPPGKKPKKEKKKPGGEGGGSVFFGKSQRRL